MVEHLLQKTGVQSLGQEDALEREWKLAPELLPGESHGQKGLVGYIHRVAKTRTRLSDSHVRMHSCDVGVGVGGSHWNLFCCTLIYPYFKRNFSPHRRECYK